MTQLYGINSTRPLYQVVADMALSSWRAQRVDNARQYGVALKDLNYLKMVNSLLLPQLEREAAKGKNDRGARTDEWFAIADQMDELQDAISSFDNAIEDYENWQDGDSDTEHARRESSIYRGNLI